MFYHEQNICSGPFSKCCSKNTMSRLSVQLRLHRIIPKILTESKHISPVVAWVMERNLAIIHLGFLYLLAQLSSRERRAAKVGKSFPPSTAKFSAVNNLSKWKTLTPMPVTTTCWQGSNPIARKAKTTTSNCRGPWDQGLEASRWKRSHNTTINRHYECYCFSSYRYYYY